MFVTLPTLLIPRMRLETTLSCDKQNWFCNTTQNIALNFPTCSKLFTIANSQSIKLIVSLECSFKSQNFELERLGRRHRVGKPLESSFKHTPHTLCGNNPRLSPLDEWISVTFRYLWNPFENRTKTAQVYVHGVFTRADYRLGV